MIRWRSTKRAAEWRYTNWCKETRSSINLQIEYLFLTLRIQFKRQPKTKQQYYQYHFIKEFSNKYFPLTLYKWAVQPGKEHVVGIEQQNLIAKDGDRKQQNGADRHCARETGNPDAEIKYNWSNNLELKHNIEKCKVMLFSYFKYTINYTTAQVAVYIDLSILWLSRKIRTR